MEKNKRISQDIKLLTMGVVLLVIAIAIIIYSFTFLINNVFPAIAPDDRETRVNDVHFDLKGFDELNL